MESLVWALQNEKPKHVDEVPNGIKCDCVCPYCGKRLIARNAGKKRQHSFMHQGDSSSTCKWAPESALHHLAKDLLLEAKILKLPPKSLDTSRISQDEIRQFGLNEAISDERTIRVSSVALEKHVSQIIPDVVVATDDGCTYFIEVYVTNKVSSEKKERIRKIGIPTIEIDLHEIGAGISREEFLAILTQDVDCKQWVWDSAIDDATEKARSNIDELKRQAKSNKTEKELPPTIAERNEEFARSKPVRRYRDWLRDKYTAEFLLTKELRCPKDNRRINVYHCGENNDSVVKCPYFAFGMGDLVQCCYKDFIAKNPGEELSFEIWQETQLNSQKPASSNSPEQFKMSF